MGRTLKTSIVHGSSYYEAGTDEDQILDADSITADVWEGESSQGVSVAEVDAEEFEKAAKALKDANATIGELRAKVAELEAQVASSPAPEGDGSDDQKGAYDDLDVDALKAEIDKRNEDRDDESKISKRGGKDTLAAALVADDEAQEG